MTTPLLQVSDLHAGYGRAEVLGGLNFQLAERQVVSPEDGDAFLKLTGTPQAADRE